jgi:hypothetical protein
LETNKADIENEGVVEACASSIIDLQQPTPQAAMQWWLSP